MSCLLYGVVFVNHEREACARPPVLPLGVGGASVRLIEADGIGLAVSTIDSADAAPNVDRALAHARVIEALHASRVVVPIRFGSLLEQEADVIHLLRTQGTEYARMLRVLDGCVEMEVRLAPRPDFVAPVATRKGPAPGDVHTGAAYLTRRKAVYAETDRGVQNVASAAERIGKAFAGRFVQRRVEAPSGISRFPVGGSPLSTYFLVRRDALERFREAFRALTRTEATPLILSGPWPPYNFVTPEKLKNHGISSD